MIDIIYRNDLSLNYLVSHLHCFHPCTKNIFQVRWELRYDSYRMSIGSVWTEHEETRLSDVGMCAESPRNVRWMIITPKPEWLHLTHQSTLECNEFLIKGDESVSAYTDGVTIDSPCHPNRVSFKTAATPMTMGHFPRCHQHRYWFTMLLLSRKNWWLDDWWMTWRWSRDAGWMERPQAMGHHFRFNVFFKFKDYHFYPF